MNESTLRTMLAERADQVEIGHPPIEDAQREGERARRRRAALFASMGAAAVVVVVAAAAMLVRPGGDADTAPTAHRSAVDGSSLPGMVPSDEDLLGSWVAVTVLGKPASQSGMTAEQLTLELHTNGDELVWGSREMCNLVGGRADLGAGGELSTGDIDMTTMNCPVPAGQPTIPHLVTETALVRVYGGDALTLYDQAGSPLATFKRTLSTPSPYEAVPSASDVLGKWQPVELGGEPVAATGLPAHRYLLQLGANADGLYWGAAAEDGCNGAGGKFRLREDGAVSTSYATTLVGCESDWPGGMSTTDAIQAVTDVRILDERLLFYDAAGERIATFEPVATPE